MHRRTASFLLFTLLAGVSLCGAGERLKVQVVQTHTGIKLGATGAADPDGADRPPARCNGDSGSDAKDRGFYCHPPDAAAPAAATPVDRSDYSLFFDVIVIMPDATRAVFHCSTILDAGCAGFPVYPQNTSVVCHDFQSDGKSYKDCTASGPSSAGIGLYQASVRGDRMTIFGPNWERHYRKKGTWDYPDPPAQDPKPASAQLINIAVVQDPKPPIAPQEAPAGEAGATPQDLKPAASQETTPPVPQDTGARAPQEPKPAPQQETPPPTQPDPKPSEALDPKPVPPQDSAPAPPQETRPDTQDPKPASPQDTASPAPQDPKSTPPEPKSRASTAGGPDTGHGPSAAVSSAAAAAIDQQVDPTVIEQAKAGDMIAQYKLGYDYYRGRGVALDYVQAAVWWKKSADQGYPQAQNNLGVLYNAGKGVPQSYAEAYFWENLAAARASGSQQTQFAKNRDESASRLWFYERSRMQRKAAKWAAEHPVAPRAQEPSQAKQ